MYRRFLVILISGALAAGCAGTPPASNVMPAGEAPEKPAAPLKDAEDKHRYALALMDREEWHAAATELEQLTTARPKLSGPWVNLGIVRTMLGEASAAEMAFERALDANDRNAEAWNQLGILYRRSNRLEKARAAYSKGLEHAPDHADLHWNLALLHDTHLPDPVLALQHFERYRELTRSDDAQLQQWIAKLREQVPLEE
ncbi:MAG: tetratricopeptide repeat protein, partial [Thiohalobacterales bacterium]|nr:tetratricopeptide repeat protein [Thiohalobacterales bacterium]